MFVLYACWIYSLRVPRRTASGINLSPLDFEIYYTLHRRSKHTIYYYFRIHWNKIVAREKKRGAKNSNELINYCAWSNIEIDIRLWLVCCWSSYACFQILNTYDTLNMVSYLKFVYTACFRETTVTIRSMGLWGVKASGREAERETESAAE